MNNPQLSIVVLNFNRLEYSKQTIENIINITKVSYELVLVDNGSNKETREYLWSLKTKFPQVNIKYAFNTKNLGISGGRNKGMILSSGDVIMTLDDDILLPEGYDTKIISAHKNLPDVGLVGISVEKRNYPIHEIAGEVIQIKKDGNINGACISLSRKLFERVGFFQSNYRAYGMEDCDLDYRVKKLKLFNCYINVKGIHLDKRLNPTYQKIKKRIHRIKSEQYKRFERNIVAYCKQKSFYVPYVYLKNGVQLEFDQAIRKNDKIYIDESQPRTLIVTVDDRSAKDDWNKDHINSIANQNVSTNKPANIRLSFRNQNRGAEYNKLIYDTIPRQFPYVESIIIVDKQDMLSKVAVEEVQKAFDNYSQVGAIYSDFSVIDDAGTVLHKKFDRISDIKDQLEDRGQNETRKIFTSVNQLKYIRAFKLDYLYDVHGFDERTNYPEFKMFGQMLDKHSVFKINKVLYVFRMREGYKNVEEMKSMQKEFKNKWLVEGRI